MSLTIDILTLFPSVIETFCTTSIVGRACDAGVVRIETTDIRSFSADRHRSVDDKPFGGGPGMVMMPGPVIEAVEAVEADRVSPSTRILLTPQGERFTQAIATELATRDHLVLICGHYEGFDERIREALQPREISIGDYVLSGGESAALVVVDAVVRLLPGALGNDDSKTCESFTDNLLEYPHYTRPRVFRGRAVPDVLLSGDHGRIAQWRTEQARKRTEQRRPDLLGQDPPADE